MKPSLLFLGNILKDFTANKYKKKTRLKEYAYIFFY